jgi:hypothetical protein
MLFGYAMPISGIGFYGKHARDLPQKRGLEEEEVSSFVVFRRLKNPPVDLICSEGVWKE